MKKIFISFAGALLLAMGFLTFFIVTSAGASGKDTLRAVLFLVCACCVLTLGYRGYFLDSFKLNPGKDFAILGVLVVSVGVLKFIESAAL